MQTKTHRHNAGDILEIGDIDPVLADSFMTRLAGLSGKNVAKNKMLFCNCRSIQTFTMKVDLLVTFLDEDSKVLNSRVVKPRRMVFGPKGTTSVLEEVIG